VDRFAQFSFDGIGSFGLCNPLPSHCWLISVVGVGNPGCFASDRRKFSGSAIIATLITGKPATVTSFRKAEYRGRMDDSQQEYSLLNDNDNLQ
jgi:hypothetical protein